MSPARVISLPENAILSAEDGAAGSRPLLEANVTTCEQCGANAVDERSICRNCGWEADARAFRADEDAQSLGETRAAQMRDLGGTRARSAAR